MLLIGMYDSPFVRRVAVTLQWLEMAYEHANWSVGKDAELIRRHNPLGRVPTLVLQDGEVLIESTLILDYLDERAGPQRALTPAQGPARRAVGRICALAVGAAEKARELAYEHIIRPAEKRHEPWQQRCAAQMRAALAALEAQCAQRLASSPTAWLVGERLSQAEVTLGCVYTFICDMPMAQVRATDYPLLASLTARLEALPAFAAVRAPWFAFEPAKG